MTDKLETLHELKRTVDAAINYIDIQQMFPRARDEICDYTKDDFDFIIGNFGVKRIRGGESGHKWEVKGSRSGLWQR